MYVVSQNPIRFVMDHTPMARKPVRGLQQGEIKKFADDDLSKIPFFWPIILNLVNLGHYLFIFLTKHVF